MSDDQDDLEALIAAHKNNQNIYGTAGRPKPYVPPRFRQEASEAMGRKLKDLPDMKKSMLKLKSAIQLTLASTSPNEMKLDALLRSVESFKAEVIMWTMHDLINLPYDAMVQKVIDLGLRSCEVALAKNKQAEALVTSLTQEQHNAPPNTDTASNWGSPKRSEP